MLLRFNLKPKVFTGKTRNDIIHDTLGRCDEIEPGGDNRYYHSCHWDTNFFYVFNFEKHRTKVKVQDGVRECVSKSHWKAYCYKIPMDLVSAYVKMGKRVVIMQHSRNFTFKVY